MIERTEIDRGRQFGQQGVRMFQRAARMVARGAAKLAKVLFKWLVRFFGLYVAIAMAVLLVLVILFGVAHGVASRNFADPTIAKVFPAELRDRCERAAAATVDPDRPEQREYAVPWSVLAAIDQVANRTKPAPEMMAAKLRPRFSYQTVQLTTETTVTVIDKATGKSTTRTTTSVNKQEILAAVNTYQGDFVFVVERVDRRMGPTVEEDRNTRTITTVHEYGTELARVDFFADYAMLDQVLRDAGLNPQSDRPLVLALAKEYAGEPGLYELTTIPELFEGSSTGSGTIDNLLGATWPTPGYHEVSSGFGYRIDPVSGERAFHSGIDIAAPKGTPVLALRGGKVLKMQRGHPVWGWVVVIDHGNGIQSLYAHLSSFNPDLHEGMQIAAGEVIGTVGSTGKSTGPHLHLTIRINGSPCNPVMAFEGR